MRALLFIPFLLMVQEASAQYYYKDIIGTKESGDLVRTYIQNKVTRVLLTSYDADNTRIEDFYVEQQFSPSNRTLKTISRSGISNPSLLISYADEKGNVIKTVDSSNIVVGITEYNYNENGQLIAISHSSSDSAQSLNKSDRHIWQWQGEVPVKMMRIKNGNDTTFVEFMSDEEGNIIEETEIRRGVRSTPVQYYYNKKNQLTDVVRHNAKAGILLPEFMFEYSGSNVIQKITVPVNNPDYLIWRYQYNDRGLKIKEAIYDKHKSLSGKIEYQYSFAQ